MPNIFNIDQSNEYLKKSHRIIRESKKQEILETYRHLSPAYLSGSTLYKYLQSDEKNLSNGDITMLGVAFTLTKFKDRY